MSIETVWPSSPLTKALAGLLSTPWAMPIMLRASGLSAKPVAVALLTLPKMAWISPG